MVLLNCMFFLFVFGFMFCFVLVFFLFLVLSFGFDFDFEFYSLVSNQELYLSVWIGVFSIFFSLFLHLI